MTAPPRLERDELTRLAYLMLGLWAFLLYALGPALPTLRRQLDVSRGVVSLHTTLVAVGAIAVGIAGDRVILRTGRRAGFWIAAVGVSVGAARSRSAAGSRSRSRPQPCSASRARCSS